MVRSIAVFAATCVFLLTGGHGICDVTGSATIWYLSPGTIATGSPVTETAKSHHSVSISGGTSGTQYTIGVADGIDIDSVTSSSHNWIVLVTACADGKGSNNMPDEVVSKLCYWGGHYVHAKTTITSYPSALAPPTDGNAAPWSFLVYE